MYVNDILQRIDGVPPFRDSSPKLHFSLKFDDKPSGEMFKGFGHGSSQTLSF